MIDIQKYIQNMEVLGQCVFQIYNNDFSYKERHDMIKRTLEAYKENRLDLFPYDELADFFSREIGEHSAGLQNYKIDRLLLRFGCCFSVFILDEFREDIEQPAWDDVCQKVQMFFIVFAEVLRAADRTDKIEQVPNVSYMRTMLEELEITISEEQQPNDEAMQQPNSKSPKCNKKEPCFRGIIQYEDKEKLLNRLHKLIDGKSGADVGSILLRAKIDGFLMRVPNRAEFENEFGKLTDDENSKAKSKWEAIRKYLNDENDTAINRCGGMNIRIFEP